MATNKATRGYPAHPFSEIYPLKEGPPLWEMSDDIKENGQELPVLLFEGKVLDGRRRQLACFRAGVEPKYKEFKGSKIAALKKVRSLNRHRRDMGEADKRLSDLEFEKIMATLLAETRETSGRPKKDEEGENETISQADVADAMGVSVETVKDVKVIAEKAIPEVRKAFQDNIISRSDAANVAREAPSVQAVAIKKVLSGKATTASAAVPPSRRRKKRTSGEPKNGAPIVDARNIQKQIDALTRNFDALANRLGSKGKEHTDCINAMNQVTKSWIAWQKKIG